MFLDHLYLDVWHVNSPQHTKGPYREVEGLGRLVEGNPLAPNPTKGHMGGPKAERAEHHRIEHFAAAHPYEYRSIHMKGSLGPRPPGKLNGHWCPYRRTSVRRRVNHVRQSGGQHHGFGPAGAP